MSRQGEIKVFVDRLQSPRLRFDPDADQRFTRSRHARQSALAITPPLTPPLVKAVLSPLMSQSSLLPFDRVVALDLHTLPQRLRGVANQAFFSSERKLLVSACF